MKNLVWFGDVSAESLPYIGEKAGCFAKLSISGLPIPPGFILSSLIFEKFLHNAGIAPTIEQKLQDLDVNDKNKLEGVSKEIQNLIINTSVDMDILEEIFESYDAMQVDQSVRGTKAEDFVKSGRDPVFVSVRCSGQVGLNVNPYASYLHIRGHKTVIAAVKACWASFFAPRALYYQLQDGSKPIRVALVVQKMINPDVAGFVAIHEKSAVMQAAYGLSYALEEGKVNGDIFHVNTSTFEVEDKKIRKKEWNYVFDSTDNKHVKRMVKEENQLVPCLSSYEIRKIIDHSLAATETIPGINEVAFSLRKGKVFLTSVRQVVREKKVENVQDKNEKLSDELRPILTGDPMCSGVAEGKIKVLREIEEGEKVKPGDIILMRVGLADFTPAMCRAGAIVIDARDANDYIVRTARELRIPCVVGTKDALATLKENEFVTVDARSGEIYRGQKLNFIFTEDNKQKNFEGVVSVAQATLLLAGHGISNGIARGKVRFVRDIGEASKVEAGDVVVFRKWNKDYEDVLRKSSAIIVDSEGDIGSAARSFSFKKMPAIIGTDVAILKLEEGQSVTVDGNKGRVYQGNVDIKSHL
jgi:pyruvate, water dikinase